VNTYVIEKLNSSADPVEVQADRAVEDKTSGRINFYTGEDLVGSFLNVTFYKKTAQA
jgi:hypothetical protein